MSNSILKLPRLLGVLLFLMSSGVLNALEFSDGFVRGLPPTQKNTAAFFTVHNSAASDWTIASVTSNAAERIEIHRHEHSNGMMAMRKLESITVEASSSLEFAPGGLHLMLMGLSSPLREGDRVRLNFTNAEGDTVVADFPVISVVNEHRHH